jgi:hypothetical protein
MDAFDGEATPGGGYERIVKHDIFDPDGIPRRIVARFSTFAGRPLRVSIVLEERRGGADGHVIRFDDAHRRFHRHRPGWPVPGEIDEYLDSVEPRLRVKFGQREIILRYTDYDAAVFGKDPQ